MKPIYKPKGKAKEYGDYAINIYTGCNHGCYYCFAPNVLHRVKEEFHSKVEPRKDIVEEVKRQIDREKITEKLIHLCFTCDPYPKGIDNTATREIIKALKETGNHVQILTKNGEAAIQDFDLLDRNDWFGVTISCSEQKRRNAEPFAGNVYDRIMALNIANSKGIKTWVSCEPVIEPIAIYHLIEDCHFIDVFKFGKLNYHPSNIDWKQFSEDVERFCKMHHRNYYFKDSLRAEMKETST